MLKKLFLLWAITLVGMPVFAQSTIVGTVLDEETNEALIGVSVFNPATGKGTVTNLEGGFSISLPDNDLEIEIAYIGYQSKILTPKKGGEDLGNIFLKPNAVGLKDVIVTSQVAIQRKTPVAVSNITFEMIEERLGNAEFPEVLKSTPGVYVTRQGGGYGDSNVKMRGFKSENLAVMINGVPVNDMEWGGVYWSNWAGLSDVTQIKQTQRGLGASKVSAPSVGGTINIITKGFDATKGGEFYYQIGNDGYAKQLFSISSGLLNDGWAFTVLGSHTMGNGYIQGTEFEGWNYYVNVLKLLNEDHSLSFTALGAPQTHYQRNNNDYLTIAEWQRVKNYMNGESPYKYNPTYGVGQNGERKMSSFNEYHKPQISLNWNWTIDPKSNLSTVLYTSIGRGNGYSGQGYTSALRGYWYGTSTAGIMNTTFRNSDGTFAYNKIQEMNEASTSGAQMIMSKNPNYHNWYGLISTYSTKFANNIDFYGGVDFRYYKGGHTNEIIDLYGGDYYIDYDSRRNVKVVNNAAAADPEWANQKLQVGDVVYRDYDGFVMQEGAFGQVEGSFMDRQLNVFVSGSLSNTSYWRYDRLYYDAEHAKSETLNFLGFTVKGGANYNFAGYHNVFANVGVISRAPYFSGGAFLQATTSHEANPKAVNEKVFSFELGYGLRKKYVSAVLNGYYTEWLNKTMTRSVGYTVEGVEDRAVINMQGVNARHMGVELEIKAAPAKWIDLTGMLSIGDWQWNNNPVGYYYNSQGQPLADTYGTIADEIGGGNHAWSQVNLKGIKVGGAAQTTYDLGVVLKLVRGLRIGANLNGFSRMFADYSITSSNLIVNTPYSFQPTWKVPGAATVDVNASYRFKLAGLDATVSGNCFNLLNQLYIADAMDGGTGTWETARVFYGFGRTWSMRLKINF